MINHCDQEIEFCQCPNDEMSVISDNYPSTASDKKKPNFIFYISKNVNSQWKS